MIKRKLDFEGTLCALFLLIMLAIISLQIITRVVFSISNTWSEELARYLFIWVIFIGAAGAAREGGHISVEFFISLFPDKAKKYVMKIGNAIWLLFCVVMFYFSSRYTINLYLSDQISQVLNIRMAYAYAALPIGFFLIIIRIIQREFLNYGRTTQQ